MDFGNKSYKLLFEMAGMKIYLTSTMISVWFVMAVLIVFALIVRFRLKRFTDVPKGFQNLVETMVEVMHDFAKDTLGEDLIGLAPIFFTLFSFIFVSNYSGLLKLRPPTADIAVTGALAVFVLVMMHGLGLYKRRWKYFKAYFEPFFVFLPINLIGEISKPISLAFRLFGNILGGLIILGLIYELLPPIMSLLWPSVLHAYFDIFSGALQAFIFTILSMTFVQQMVEGE